MNGEGGEGGGGAGGGDEDPSRLRVEKVGISALPKDITRRLPEGAMPMSLGNTFSQDVPIGCPGTSPLDVLGHPYVMSWDISM